MTDLPIFYINLDRATERSRHMRDNLVRLGVAQNSERIAAVDAAQEGARDGFRRDYRSLSWQVDETVKACFESHRKAWQRVVDKGVPRAVIMEDDLLFSPRFAASLAEIEQNAPEFDCIKIDGNPFDMRMGAKEPCGGISVRPLLAQTFSSAAYMISRAGAQRLLRETEAYGVPVDLFMFTPRNGWKMYVADPGVCVQGMLVSNEDTSELSEQVAGSHRLDGGMWYDDECPEPFLWSVKCAVQRRFCEMRDVLWRDRAIRRRGGVIGPVPLQEGFARYRW